MIQSCMMLSLVMWRISRTNATLEDPNDPELYDTTLSLVMWRELEILMIQSCMMLSLVMWIIRELEIIIQ